jgi:hypothetical protein
MASQSQIVPSKNALRALRKLALGGSTVVGAVGSVSGLACVSYDIRQRIQLAESIVETKRVLHSQPISNPNRKAQMAAVYDMYEKGHGKEGNESWRDFSRRAQRHSADENLDGGHDLDRAVAREDAVRRTDIASRRRIFGSETGVPHNTLSKPIVPSMPSKLPWEQARSTAEDAASSSHSQNSLAARRIIAATQKAHKINTHAVYGRPMESPNVSHVQKIIIATQRQHKLSSDVVFARPARRKDDGVTKLASCVQQWLAPADVPTAGPVHISSKRPNVLHSAVRKEDRPRHKSSLATSPEEDFEDPSAWQSTAESPFSSAFFPQNEAFIPNNAEIRENNHASDPLSLQPASEGKADAVLQETKIQRAYDNQSEEPHRAVSTPQDIQSKLMALLESNLWVADANVDELHDISASPVYQLDVSKTAPEFRAHRIADMEDSQTKLAAYDESTDLLESLFAMITALNRRSGRNAAHELANNALNIYAQGGQAEHFRAMHLLYSEFHRMLRLPFTPAVRQLVHFLLNTDLDEDRRKAGRILFNTESEDTRTNDIASTVINYHHDKQARKYIDWLCSGPATKSQIVHEFRRFLQVLYQRGGEPTEGMFSPVLELFLERGDLNYLRNMFEEMKSAHFIEPSGLTRTILLHGYAKANDWGQIAKEFEKMHQDGWSRKEPMSYAVTFNAVFQQHALSEPVEKTHDFLVNAICYWGLVPSTAVSATAVQTYIRHRRYDLIKEWIEAARHMFPHVNTGGAAFAYTLAQTWGEIGASCEQIEDTCASIMRGRDDVVPGHFHGIVGEALAFHLARKVHTINADGEPLNGEIHQVKDADDLLTQLKAAFAVILDEAGESGVVKQGSVADLLSQTSAALRLRELFGAKTRIAAPDVQLAANLDRGPRGPANRQKPQSKDLKEPIPAVLRRETLPDRDTVTSLVQAHYARQLKLGATVSHEVLEVGCHGLNQTHRHYDILCLITTIYLGPAVQGPKGVMFDIGIIQTWLQTAYHLKSPVACKEILTAVLDNGAGIRLTRQFMLLLSMATNKATTNRFRTLDTLHKNVHMAKEIADLDFLVNRLRDRFYRQRANPDIKGGRKHDGLLNERKAKCQGLKDLIAGGIQRA